MADASLELQGAIIARLKANAGVTALVAGRVFDTVPAGSTFPYVVYEDDQISPEPADCYEGTTHFVTLNAWSRTPGWPELRRLVNAIRSALIGDLGGDPGLAAELGTNRLVEIALEDVLFRRDPDGLTRQAVITLRAHTEPV